MNNDKRIQELFNTVTDPQHVVNINREAFNDISKVLLSFHDKSHQDSVKMVCGAYMGHGKSTCLIAYLKWITKQKEKQPVLVVIREKQLAHDVYKEVSKLYPNSIININSENREFYESDLSKYQIVIIQHQRLKNFALGFGNINNYSTYKPNKKTELKRFLIIDEKPDFVDSAIFDINSYNNVLDWFEHLSEPLNLLPMQLQKYKSYIILLLQEQLSENLTDHTIKLMTKDDLQSIRGNNLLTILEQMIIHESNQTKYDSLNKLKHFKNLLLHDNCGRIDDYDYHRIGRKIIISNLIDYSKLGMNIFILDGTAKANVIQYKQTGFTVLNPENRNDYTRLYIQVDSINTTKYSRSKKDRTTQLAISKRIKELRSKKHKNIFVLPIKEDIEHYIEFGAIVPEEQHIYFDDNLKHHKGINLLNTTGKNILKDVTALYITCLPKRHTDYYKCLALALYGDDITNLLTNEETDNGDWFRDKRLEIVYRLDLYAEILQIIHRTALRKIDNKDKIYVYMAYDDEELKTHLDNYTITPISTNINKLYLKEEANILDHHKIIDTSLYGRNKKIEGFTNIIKEKLSQTNEKELSLSKVSKSLRDYIKKHWNKQEQTIVNEFNNHDIHIYIDESDKRKTKKVRLL